MAIVGDSIPDPWKQKRRNATDVPQPIDFAPSLLDIEKFAPIGLYELFKCWCGARVQRWVVVNHSAASPIDSGLM